MSAMCTRNGRQPDNREHEQRQQFEPAKQACESFFMIIYDEAIRLARHAKTVTLDFCDGIPCVAAKPRRNGSHGI